LPHAEVFYRHDVLTLRREDDSKWPQKNKDGRQELEIRLGNEHISFEVWEFEDGITTIGSLTGLYRLRKSAHWWT
jgi:hypothetical protein